MSLHVIQLGPVPPPEGGITRNIAAIRDELTDRGNRCTLVATSKSSSIREAEDVLHPRSPLALIATLRKMPSDVVHLHIGGDVTKRVLMLALAVTVFGRGRKVLSLHSGGYAESPEGRSARPMSLAGNVFRRFDKVIAVNAQLAETLRRYGVRDEKLAVILPFALKVPNDEAEIPSEINLFRRSHPPLLVSVGGLEKDYEPNRLLDAFAKVREELAGAGLLIVGGGSMQEMVERSIEEKGLGDSVHLAGDVDHEVVLHLIRDADALLRITLFDGDAISVREGLFLGTPVIATDNGMRPDGVHLVSVGCDAEDLAAQTLEVLDAGKPASGDDESDTTNIAAVIDLYSSLTGEL